MYKNPGGGRTAPLPPAAHANIPLTTTSVAKSMLQNVHETILLVVGVSYFNRFVLFCNKILSETISFLFADVLVVLV